MAKHEVLLMVLERKVPDGKWQEVGQGIEREINRERAISVLRECRNRYYSKSGIKAKKGEPSLMAHFPELEIGYDYRQKVHYVRFITVDQIAGVDIMLAS